MPRIRKERPSARSRMRAADDQGVALAAPAAKRGRAGAQPSAFELERNTEHKTCAACPDGVAQGDCAAIDVDAFFVHFQHSSCVERYCRKCLVELDEVEVADFEAGLFQRIAKRKRRDSVQPGI